MLLPDTISRLAFARAEQKVKPAPGATVPTPPPVAPPKSTREILTPRSLSKSRIEAGGIEAAGSLSDLLKPNAGAEMDFKIKTPSGIIAARG